MVCDALIMKFMYLSLVYLNIGVSVVFNMSRIISEFNKNKEMFYRHLDRKFGNLETDICTCSLN